MQSPQGIDRPVIVETAAAPEPRVAPRWDPSRLTDRLPAVLAFGVALTWVAGLWAVLSLAPPVDPNEPVSLLGILIGDLTLLALVAGAVGLGMRRRWGLAAALFGGGVLLFGAVACQLTGHSGTWLAAQYVAGASLAAFSWGGLKAT